MINPNDITIIPITAEHQLLITKMIEEIAELKRENNGISFIEFGGGKNMKLFSHQGIIKGFCEVYSSLGLPYIDVYVLKEFRGQGLGPAVTEKLKQQLFDRGYEAVGIRVHKNNKRAIESAIKSGFTMITDGVELNPDNQAEVYYEFIARNYRREPETRRSY
jgi:ribosomal protein S18 acetylase RimI-like enzyme